MHVRPKHYDRTDPCFCLCEKVVLLKIARVKRKFQQPFPLDQNDLGLCPTDFNIDTNVIAAILFWHIACIGPRYITNLLESISFLISSLNESSVWPLPNSVIFTITPAFHFCMLRSISAQTLALSLPTGRLYNPHDITRNILNTKKIRNLLPMPLFFFISIITSWK